MQGSVRVDRSAIHGPGVFTLAPIAQGVDRLALRAGVDLDPPRIESRPELFRQALLHDRHVAPRPGRFVPCGDDAHFPSHSDTPDLVPLPDAEPHGIDVATRPIDAGEELALDDAALEGSRPGESA